MKLILLMLTLLVSTAAGQSKDTLVKSFGEPGETFNVSEWITVTAHYSADKTIDSLNISLRYSGIIASRSEFNAAERSLSDVLAQLVPASSRGKLVRSGFFNPTCLPGSESDLPVNSKAKLPPGFKPVCSRSFGFEEYENLTIHKTARYSDVDAEEMLRIGPPFIEVYWKK